MARRKVTADELLTRAESNGCQEGAHREENCTRDLEKHGDKTKRDQKFVLGRWHLPTFGQNPRC